MLKYKNLDFKMTCFACPEQYDIFKNNKQVGYVRLRWGHLTCEYPDVNNKLVYNHNFDDPMKGCFSTDEEREEYLTYCAESINKALNNRDY